MAGMKWEWIGTDPKTLYGHAGDWDIIINYQDKNVDPTRDPNMWWCWLITQDEGLICEGMHKEVEWCRWISERIYYALRNQPRFRKTRSRTRGEH